jgi:hypothetical protein
MPARTTFPLAPLTPAQMEPTPLAILAGDFKTRPHFLHLGFPSMRISFQEYTGPGGTPGLVSL